MKFLLVSGPTARLAALAVSAALFGAPALAEEAKTEPKAEAKAEVKAEGKAETKVAGHAEAFKADPAKGATLAAACGACHTQDGSRGTPQNPILQGQHPEYIVKQLVEFKGGKRQNPVMSGMAASIPTEQDMKHIAAFYASKTAKPGFAKNKDTVRLGEQIYRAGIASKQIPACAGCHSPNGAGIPAQYPRLAGQHPEYAEAQLLAFRAGTRANSTQMMGIASKMNDAEIKAVADYVAGLR